MALKLKQPRRLFTVLTDVLDAETRYRRWRHLDNVRQRLHEERVAQRRSARTLAMKSGVGVVGGDESDSEDEDPFLMIEAKENMLLKVPKPATTIDRLAKHMSPEELHQALLYVNIFMKRPNY